MDSVDNPEYIINSPDLNEPQDDLQARLNLVNHRLHRHSLFRGLTLAQLPSQAASDTSISPPLGPSLHGGAAGRFVARSPLHLAIDAVTLDSSSEVSVEGLDQRLAELGIQPRASGKDKETELHRYGSHHSLPVVSSRQFQQAWLAFSKMTIPSAGNNDFVSFTHDHKEIINAVDFNYYGTRMVTASSDHLLKVWDKATASNDWVLVDTWRGHDAEITDVKWNGPFLGSILGSIGEDGKFKLWQEDVAKAPNSRERFRVICTLFSETRVPFMGLDFKNLLTETYLALVTRDGYLSIYEPTNQEDLRNWQGMKGACTHLIASPSRSDESSFRVCWHKEQLACYGMLQAGLDRKSLSIAVACMTSVKILRTDKNRAFYLAAEITGHKGSILRDVAWANGSMRGWDVIATAGKDGSLRIYELHALQGAPSTGQDMPLASDAASIAESTTSTITSSTTTAKLLSGIGAGLSSGGSSGTPSKVPSEKNRDPSQVRNMIKKVADLKPHEGSVWRVAFSQNGDLLISTGHDSVIKTWKRTNTGQWLEYASIEMQDSSEEDDDDTDDELG